MLSRLKLFVNFFIKNSCHDGPSTSFKCIPCNRYFSDQLFYQQHNLQHSKIGDGVETIDTVNCTDCNQQIHNKNDHYHIPTNAHYYFFF